MSLTSASLKKLISRTEEDVMIIPCLRDNLPLLYDPAKVLQHFNIPNLYSRQDLYFNCLFFIQGHNTNYH